jgi:hypothetical protein
MAGTTTGNAYWALAMQKYRFVSMSLRGSEFVHQPNPIVRKCNTRLEPNSTSILTTCTRELCRLSFMTQDPKMWTVTFKMPVWWPKIFKSKITDINTTRIEVLPSLHKFLDMRGGTEQLCLNFAIDYEEWPDHVATALTPRKEPPYRLNRNLGGNPTWPVLLVDERGSLVPARNRETNLWLSKSELIIVLREPSELCSDKWIINCVIVGRSNYVIVRG